MCKRHHEPSSIHCTVRRQIRPLPTAYVTRSPEPPARPLPPYQLKRPERQAVPHRLPRRDRPRVGVARRAGVAPLPLVALRVDPPRTRQRTRERRLAEVGSAEVVVGPDVVDVLAPPLDLEAGLAEAAVRIRSALGPARRGRVLGTVAAVRRRGHRDLRRRLAGHRAGYVVIAVLAGGALLIGAAGTGSAAGVGGVAPRGSAVHVPPEARRGARPRGGFLKVENLAVLRGVVAGQSEAAVLVPPRAGLPAVALGVREALAALALPAELRRRARRRGRQRRRRLPPAAGHVGEAALALGALGGLRAGHAAGVRGLAPGGAAEVVVGAGEVGGGGAAGVGVGEANARAAAVVVDLAGLNDT